jgi:tagatose 6-phosphate kinase
MILTVTMNPAIDKVYAIDDFCVNKVFRPKAMTATPGGKGLNVARVAYLLGEEVMATGLIGGNNGRTIHSQVEASGINSCFVPIEGESRICINIMDEKNTTSTEVLEPGPVISEDECREFIRRYTELVDTCRVVTASGSLPSGVQAPFYRELIRIAREKGRKFLLDTSGEALLEGIEEKPYMVKPNQDEIQKVTGRPPATLDDCKEALGFLLSKGVEVPVISMGMDGCAAAWEKEFFRFSAPPIQVVNTVGSGDSFIAGCAVAFNRGLEPMEAIKLGMACGMANTQFFKTGMISKELVERFLKEIRVEAI